MSSNGITGDYEVGYGRPPQHSRFKPGESGNPRGRPPKPKPDAASVTAILDAPVEVRTARGMVKMPRFEAGVRKLVSAAVNGDIAAARAFLQLCDKYKVIAPAKEPENYFEIPRDWDDDEWKAKFRKDGPPPWPGKRSGMPKEKLVPEPEPEPGRRRRKGRPLSRQETVTMIANETHSVGEGARRRCFTTLELVLTSVANLATSGNARTFKAYHDLLQRYAPKTDAMARGYIIVSEELPVDEWVRMVAELRAKGHDV